MEIHEDKHAKMTEDMYCFCKQQISSWSGKWLIKFDDDKYHCNPYLAEKLMLLVVPLILSLITTGSKKILRIFSTWEGRHSIPK